MPSRRTIIAAALAALLVGFAASRPSEALSIRLEIDGPRECPKGLLIETKAVKGGMVDVVVHLDAESIAQGGELYRGRVGETASLDIATGERKIASVPLKGRKGAEKTRYSFRLSGESMEASRLHIALNLFEKDGTATVGGGVSMEIRLVGFQPAAPAAEGK